METQLNDSFANFASHIVISKYASQERIAKDKTENIYKEFEFFPCRDGVNANNSGSQQDRMSEVS